MRYTPFDLPKTITQGALPPVTFAYDGEAQRIRKTTPDAAPAQRGRGAGHPPI
jgi:hypothetical protein